MNYWILFKIILLLNRTSFTLFQIIEFLNSWGLKHIVSVAFHLFLLQLFYNIFTF